MTRSPSRGPGGIEICSFSWRFSADSGFGDELVVRGDARLALGLAGAGRHAHPLELALRACGGASRRPSPPARAAAPSVRASSCSCPPTGCRSRGRARGSSPRRCRGSSGRASPRRRCRGTPAGGVRATRPISASRWFVGSSSSKQIGLAEQQAAQRDPAALATAQLRRRRRRRAGSRSASIAISSWRSRSQPLTRVDLVLELRLLGEQLVEVGVGLAHRVADLLEAVEQALRVRDAVDDVAEHVLRRVELRLLRQVADREARA